MDWGQKVKRSSKTVMLVEGELTLKSSTFAAPQDSISTETLALRRIHTTSVQSLLNTPQNW